MNHDKSRDKFKDESQDARRRDEHNVVHPDDQTGKEQHKSNQTKDDHHAHDKKK